MSEEKVGNILKLNVPEFMRGMKHLDEYLDVSAEVMGDIRDEIDSLGNMKHYRKSDDGLVDVNLVELGFNVPVNIKLSVKRQLLRDLAEIHLRSGTSDGISHLLRIIGIEPELSKGWILNPDLVRDGQMRDHFTGDEGRHDTSDREYMDLLYGDVVDTEDGTFFEGYRYWDTNREVSSGRIPIVGEIYDGSVETNDTVESSPYLIIRFDADDIFLVDANQSIDPETGKVFPYSVSERFTLLEDIIEFFLVGEYRPTTLRIVVEVQLLEITELLEVSDVFDIQVDKANEESFTESMTAVETLRSTSVVETIRDVRIGDTGTLIGVPSPIYTRWFGVELEIGDMSRLTNLPVIESWDEMTTTHHIDALTRELVVPLLGQSVVNTSGLPSHILYGIRGNNVKRPLQGGEIPSEYIAIEIQITGAIIGRHEFTITRLRRDGYGT